MAKDFIREYAEALAAISPAAATEISYRSAQEKLLRDAAAALAAENEIGESFEILNEPQREGGAGAPDFRVAARGHGVVGYVESKAPGAHLESIARGAQMEKYRGLSENIVLTDTRVFLLLRAGKIIASANLSDSDASPRLSLAPDMAKQDRDDLRRLLKRFLRYPPSALADAKQLAVYLADPCRDLRDGLAAILSDPNIKATRLRGLLQEFRRCVTDNLSEEQFADVFAQTLVYGLFMARLNAPSGEQIDFHSQRHIPQNFALVSELVDFLPELQKPDYESILWIGEDILAIVRAIDVAEIKRSLSFDGKKALAFFRRQAARFRFRRQQGARCRSVCLFLRAFSRQIRSEVAANARRVLHAAAGRQIYRASGARCRAPRFRQIGLGRRGRLCFGFRRRHRHFFARGDAARTRGQRKNGAQNARPRSADAQFFRLRIYDCALRDCAFEVVAVSRRFGLRLRQKRFACACI